MQFQGDLTFGRKILYFDVTDDVQSVCISGTTVKKGFLYAAVYDANDKYRGTLLLLKPVKTMNIKVNDSSFAAIDGELCQGQWKIELYNLEGEFRRERATQYQVEICFNQDVASIDSEVSSVTGTEHQITFNYEMALTNESRWYKGDLHAHTQLSDGHNRLEDAVEIIESQNLDYFFFTEHNMTHPALPISERCLYMPALEVTTDLGHFNVHGALANLDLRKVDHNSQAIIEAGLALAGDDNSHSSISINHPMMKPWHWQYESLNLSKVSTFEVCCDPTWSTSPKSTEQALLVLNEMWNAGHKITAIGGSDSHLLPHERNPNATEPSIYGDPSTYVFSHGLSGYGILSGLKTGKVYIERQCGLSFSINQGQFIPGDDTQGQKVVYSLAINDGDNNYYAECVINGEVKHRLPLSIQPQQLVVEKGYAWCRIDIRRGLCPDNSQVHRGEFEACINPIFNGQDSRFSTPSLHTWGELMARVDLDETADEI